MIPMHQNPWIETEGASQADKAIATVHRAQIRAETLTPSLPSLPLQDFAKDLAFIEDAYRADITAYRRTRALTAVHLPTIIELIEALAGMARKDDPERFDALTRNTRTCLRAASDARQAIESQALSALEISAATTAERIAAAGQEPDQEEQGMLTRGWRSTTVFAGRLGAKMTDPLVNATADASRRMGGGVAYARTSLSGLFEDGMHALTAPITTRANAARSALTSASISAIVGGLVVAIVFPPAAPLALGLSFLEAPDLYSDALRNERKALQHSRAGRDAEREQSTLASLRALRGESPVIRMETPYIAMTLNLDEGTADGVILAGRHTGRTLGSLAADELRALIIHAPDTETQKILQRYEARLGSLRKES